MPQILPNRLSTVTHIDETFTFSPSLWILKVGLIHSGNSALSFGIL